jgi:hypothetical protein
MPHLLNVHVAARKGRVGGVVYAKSPQGAPYLASRVYQPDVFNPKSFKQRFRRAALTAANGLWHQLTTPVVPLVWKGQKGHGRIKLSEWNAFCHKALANATVGWGPQLSPTPTPSTPVTGVVVAAVPSSGMVTLSWTDPAVAGNILWIAVGLTATPQITQSQLVHVTTAAGAQLVTLSLPPGTYYFRTYVTAAADGQPGAPGTATAAITVPV